MVQPSRSSGVVISGRKDDYFGGRWPFLDPSSLRPGIDRVTVGGSRSPSAGIPVGSVGTWCGHFRERAAIRFAEDPLPILLDGFCLQEVKPIPSSVNFEDFRDGWHTGFEAAVSGEPVSSKSSRKKPTDFGRGVTCGYRRAMEPMVGKVDFYQVEEDYNALVRELAAQYPGEHWVWPGGPGNDEGRRANDVRIDGSAVAT